MEFKGTKGEWKIGNHKTQVVSSAKHKLPSNNEPSSLEHYGGYLICESVLDDYDAKLIAAAPKLLKALQDLLDAYRETIELEYGDGHKKCEEEKQAIKAINQALK